MPAVLFCLDHTLLTPLGVNNSQLLRNGKPIRLLETPRPPSEYMLNTFMTCLISSFFFLTGIEMKFKNQNYPILIAPTHIPELNVVEKTSDGIKFGASVPLSTIEDVLTEATQTMPGKQFDRLLM